MTREKRPRWRNSFTDQSVLTKGGRLNKIRESRLNGGVSEVSQGVETVVLEQLSGETDVSCKQTVDQSFIGSSEKKGARSKTSSGVTISDLSSVSLTSR